MIRKKHPGINLLSIHFFDLEAHNIPDIDDAVVVDLELKTDHGEDDVEVEDSTTLEDPKGASNKDHIVVKSSTDLFPPLVMDIPPHSLVTDLIPPLPTIDVPQKVEICKFVLGYL